MTKNKSKQVLFNQGNFTWYNQLNSNITPILIKPNQFKNWGTLTDFLLEKISPENRPPLWDKLDPKKRQLRVQAFHKVFKQRNLYTWSNQFGPNNCYGWKVVETNRYEELIETIDIYFQKPPLIDDFFDKGNVTVINQNNSSLESFYIPPKGYSRSKEEYLKDYKNKQHPGLIQVGMILYKKLYPNTKISAEIKNKIYGGFYKLFTQQRKSYLGFIVNNSSTENTQITSKNNLGLMTTSYQFDSFLKNNDLNSILQVVTDFYKEYFPDLVSSWLNFLQRLRRKTDFNFKVNHVSSSLKQSEIINFPTSLVNMQNYLTTSSSAYHKLCLFFLINNISDKEYNKRGITKLENHHIIPKHLSRQHPELEGSIDKSFNLIRVSWIQHYHLHFIRFIEFTTKDDYTSISIMYKFAQQLLDEKSNSNESNYSQLVFNLFKSLKTWLNNKSAQEKLNQDDQSRTRNMNQQNSEIRNLYTQDTIWKNNWYSTLPDLVVPANKIQLHTDLVPILREHLNNFLEANPNICKPKNWYTINDRNLSNYISRHLRYQFKEDKSRHATAFWGFYISL